MSESLRIQRCSGSAINAWLPELARLRIQVFREFPYLYDGSAAYEENYLKIYVNAPDSVMVLAQDGEQVVGASSGLPLEAEPPSVTEPFLAHGHDPRRIFYYGESVLLPEYRGRGIGHGFFDAREAHARSLGGFKWCAFAAVERQADDPRCPTGHRGNDAFWHKRGYRRSDIAMQLPWNETGRGETGHTLGFWLRPLEEIA